MTTPGGVAPGGAHQQGGKFGQDETEASARQKITQPTRDVWQIVQDAWKGRFEDQGAVLADQKDGQVALNGRLDLLQATAGHACAFMSHTYTVPPSTVVRIPFNTQLGPMKKAGVDTSAGRLVLKAGGLWRVDSQTCIEGYTLNQTIIPTSTAPFFTVITTYDAIVPHYVIQVMRADGSILSSRVFDGVTGVSMGASGFSAVAAPNSSHFSHTFVLDNMPPEDDPSAPEHWVYVQVSMIYTPVATGTFSNAFCTLNGGTKRSALTASRWSRDVANIVNAPTVPDGGAIT
ncbi:hypothetical protein [Antrihabitans cavernicola]|uniref:Uncharacterized protein n=1 Tax=Antrihabitans cavernicola TaxID=2495913 RepID=A0A5A7S497_9NOCA|nr:hypothetical protein [Spelaeibacter cavernicola]KAA0016756.1 hypothetical protein FOY51_25760 [Spelaeibacter cavernicola]